jgi:hypothetical protein
LPDWAYASEESSEEIGKGKGKAKEERKGKGKGKEKPKDESSEEIEEGKGKAKEEGKGKGKGKEKPKRKARKESAGSKPKRRRMTDYDQSVMYSEEEEHRRGESATTGMIRGALRRSGPGSEGKGAQQSGSDEEFLSTSSAEK